MTIRELEAFLKTTTVRPYTYSLYEGSGPTAEVAHYIRERGNGYEVFVTERNKLIESVRVDTEEEACNKLLKLLIKDNPWEYEVLSRHIT